MGNYFLGSIFLGIYLLAGVVFSVAVQLLGTSPKGEWNKPYFESFFYHAVWVLVVPVAWIVLLIERRRHHGVFPPVPWRQLVIWGGFSGPGIVISSFLYFLALARLPLSLNSAIAQCYFVFVFVLSLLLFKEEKATLFRIVALAVCIGGVSMTAVSGLQQNSGGDTHLLCCTWDGYLFLLASMVVSAVYQIMWSLVMRPVKDAFGNSLFLGFAGLASTGVSSLALTWIGLVIGNYSGLETFELPPVGPVLDGVFISCGMDFLLNGANLFAILFVSPIFVSVGSLLLVPLNIIAQFIFSKTSPNALGWSGIVLILVGCVGFEMGELIWTKIRGKGKINDESIVTLAEEEQEEEEEEEQQSMEKAPLLMTVNSAQ